MARICLVAKSAQLFIDLVGIIGSVPLLSARNTTLQSLIYIPGTTSHKLWLLSQPTFKFAGKGYKISEGIFNFNFKKRSTKLDSVNFFFT